MSNEYQSTPILHSVMLEMELFTQPYTLVPNPLSDPDLCWSNTYDTPDNDDLHEFYLDGNGVWGRHYLNFKCPIYAGRDVNADSLADDAYLFVFSAGGGKVNDTFELFLSQSSRGLDFMKSWAYIYDIDKLWMNDTIPLSLGSDVFFTRGMNHGITGGYVPYGDDQSALEFYTKLPETFTGDDELTFYIPVEPRDENNVSLFGFPGMCYTVTVTGYDDDMAQTGATQSMCGSQLIGDSLLVSGEDGNGLDGRWDDTSTTLVGATTLHFSVGLWWDVPCVPGWSEAYQDYGEPIACSPINGGWKFWMHDANSDFDMGVDANFYNRHMLSRCVGVFTNCVVQEDIDFTVYHAVQVGPGMWSELSGILGAAYNYAPLGGPQFLYDSFTHDPYLEEALVCIGSSYGTWCVPSSQLTIYETEFVQNAQIWEDRATDCAGDLGWGENDLTSTSLYTCTKFLTWDSGQFIYRGVKFYGQTHDWYTQSYDTAVEEQFPGQNVAGYITFKEIYAILNFEDGAMWEAAWLVGAFAEGVIKVGVTILQENVNQISNFLVSMTRFMVFLFIMGSIIGSTSIIHHSLHGRWSIVNFKCASTLSQSAGFLSAVPYVGAGMTSVARGAVGSMNRYRPPLRKPAQKDRRTNR